MMSIEEAKKMEGTEFVYVFPDGDEIKAYVKKFDPEIGLTCMSLEAETRDGWVIKDNEVEKDGTFCVCAGNLKDIPKYNTERKEEVMNDILEILQKIKDTGRHAPMTKDCGSPSCAFMP